MTDLLASLTRDGRRALGNAKRIAKEYDQPFIDSEGLLLGLLQLSGSQAETVLETLHIRPEMLTARLAASIKLNAKQTSVQAAPETVGLDNFTLTTGCRDILLAASNEGQQYDLDFVDPRLLVLGMLRSPHTKAGEFLSQYGLSADRFREAARLKETPVTNLPRFDRTRFSPGKILFFGISPVFIGLVLLTLLAGYLTYAGIGNARGFMFFFVIGGWIVSVALHEFGHAIAAYWGGDFSVVDKGYLTLNPLKYTHPFLSIVLPVIFVIIGGIGFPGGAVYVNVHLLRSSLIRSLTSAAGPLATMVCVAALVTPFIFQWPDFEAVTMHFEFWAGLALLAFLQLTALFLNLLPIPGLDGFGIVEPFLSPGVQRTMNQIRPFGFFILYGLLFIDTPIRDSFWNAVWDMIIWIDPGLAWLANEGLGLFRLWG